MTTLELSEWRSLVMLLVVETPMITIKMTIEMSFTLQKNIYSAGVTHVDSYLQQSYFYSSGREY